MLAIGCLFPVILMVVGGGVGFAFGNSGDGIWGGAGGLVLGFIAMLALLWGFEQARSRR
jgi:hypothetical protein